MGNKKSGYKAPRLEGVSQPIDMPDLAKLHAYALHEDASGQRVEEPKATASQANPYAMTGWQKKSDEEFDLDLPSGQRCRVRKLTPNDVFKLGLLDMLDVFSPELLSGKDPGKAAARKVDEVNALRDKKKRNQLFDTVDQVVVACVVFPRVVAEETDVFNPETTALVGDIEITDKMFIFGAVFGNDVNALKSVYEGAANDLGAAFQRQDVRSEAKSTTGN